jgi:hypothetical protein
MPSVYLGRFVRCIGPLLVLVTLSATPLPSWSQELTIDQMTRRASVIVEGQVTSVHGDWNTDHTKIYTTLRLQVARYHKGSASPGTLDIRFLGGTVGDMALVVIDQPTFSPGERVFLFLSPNFDTSDTPIVGQYEGKLRMTTNAQGQDVLLGSTQTFEKSDVVSSIRAVLRPIGQ